MTDETYLNPAFPSGSFVGMSKREYYAAQAMTAILRREKWPEGVGYDTMTQMAKSAVAAADILIAELAAPQSAFDDLAEMLEGAASREEPSE